MNEIHLQLNGRFGEFELDIDLITQASGVTALFGHSAAGKTTLLRCIAGLEDPQTSYINIAGEIWQDSQKDIFLPTHRRSVGYVFQESLLFPHLNVESNIRYGLKRTNIRSSKLAIEEVIDFLQLSSLLKRMPSRLSGGEQKRVAIARALVSNPKLLMMDEPLANLDAEGKQEILPFLERMHRELEVPMFYVCHSMEEVVRLADFIVLLAQGKVLDNGELLEVLEKADRFPGLEGSVLVGKVTKYDADYVLTEVAIANQCLLVGGRLGDEDEDEEVRLFVSMKDVSITLEATEESSILNILPVKVVAIDDFDAGSVVVRLAIAETDLMPCINAKITKFSSQKLGLVPGLQVFAQIKGVALAR